MTANDNRVPIAGVIAKMAGTIGLIYIVAQAAFLFAWIFQLWPLTFVGALLPTGVLLIINVVIHAVIGYGVVAAYKRQQRLDRIRGRRL